MSTTTFKQDRKQILDELERYYQHKLDGVRAKRASHGKRPEQQEILACEGVRIRVNAKRKEVVLSWDTSEEKL